MDFPTLYDEADRLSRLADLEILRTGSNPRIDALTARTLAAFPGASIGAVSLIEHDRLWFRSIIGLSVTEVPRGIAFCAHTILSSRPLVVPDTALDRRFAKNPLVTGDAPIRFYAGIALLDGLGSLCVMGPEPRATSPKEISDLAQFARLVEAQLLMESALTSLAQPPRHQCEKMSGVS